jgi:hypothetical protein
MSDVTTGFQWTDFEAEANQRDDFVLLFKYKKMAKKQKRPAEPAVIPTNRIGASRSMRH